MSIVPIKSGAPLLIGTMLIGNLLEAYLQIKNEV